MVNYRAQIVLKTADNNAANYSTNTWYCSATTVADAEDFVTAVWQSYQDFRPHLSTLTSQNGNYYKLYDLADPEPRAPVSEGLLSFTSAPAGAPAPPEVCLCLSYQAARISGEPQARRRGRVYIGPITVNSVATTGRPSSTMITAWETAGQDLLDLSNAASDWTWGQYSTVTTGLAPVDNGWVDDEFDTQRRRGRVMTARTVFA